MTTTNANATHAVQAKKNGSAFCTLSFHASAKKAAKHAASLLGRGFTAKVVAL
jgi:hypothetical protein